jgi:hypothetical protein
MRFEDGERIASKMRGRGSFAMCSPLARLDGESQGNERDADKKRHQNSRLLRFFLDEQNPSGCQERGYESRSIG